MGCRKWKSFHGRVGSSGLVGDHRFVQAKVSENSLGTVDAQRDLAFEQEELDTIAL